MPRWEPDAQARLMEAALDLFVEQGYDETTVAQIAQRAGLTKSTFFRHFRDKREVLFAGQEVLFDQLVSAIAGAPEDAGPLDAVAAALDAARQLFNEERHSFAARRQIVITANPELQEREALKLGGLSGAVVEALRQRGVAEPAAAVSAELGLLAFRTGFARWVEADDPDDFGTLARQALEELQAASVSLSINPAG